MTDTNLVASGNNKVGPISFVFGAADTSKSATVYATKGPKGRITRAFLVLPNWTNAVTATIALADADGFTLFSEAGLAENQTHDIKGLDAIVAEDCTATVTLSGAPGGSGGTAQVAFYVSDAQSNEISIAGAEQVTETNSAAIKTAVEQLEDETTGCATDTQNTVTLPGSADTPAEIDTTTAGLLEVTITIAHDFSYCFAANAIAGLARFGAGTVCTCPPGVKTIPIKGCTNKLYVRSADTVADVIGIDWVEEAA